MPDLLCTNDRYCPTRDVFASVDEFQTMARLAFGAPVALRREGNRWLDHRGETVLIELDPAEPPSKVALTGDEIEAALRRRIQMRELVDDDHGFEEPPGRVADDAGVIGYYEQAEPKPWNRIGHELADPNFRAGRAELWNAYTNAQSVKEALANGIADDWTGYARHALAELERIGHIDPPCDADVDALAAALERYALGDAT